MKSFTLFSISFLPYTAIEQIKVVYYVNKDGFSGVNIEREKCPMP